MAVDFNALKYPQVVIIGGGFAGLTLVKELNKLPYKVILIDRNNFHTFQPLLYQVASGGLGSDAIAHPFRKIIGKMDRVAFRMAEVLKIDTEGNKVETNIGDIPYDYLVIASGATNNFFGMEDIEQTAMPLKKITDALDIRSDFLEEFERALVAKTEEEQRKILNFTIVGGGPTGVELAGALAEIKRFVMPKDYRELDPDLMCINLIQSGPRVLATMSTEASVKAKQFLKDLGVQVILNAEVVGYDGSTLQLSSGETFETSSVIWSAGVKGQTIKGLNNECIIRGNRYKADVYNRIGGYNNIFAIGDIAAVITEDNPMGDPMLAQVAIQQAKNLGRNFKRLLNNMELKPFKYKDKGSMATVGRNKAVCDLPYIKLQGAIAWYIWMFVHLMSLVGFRNRALVFFNWMWNYFTYDRAIRLIIRPFKQKFVNKNINQSSE